METRPYPVRLDGRLDPLAYVALMGDECPPFRLDTGGTDPGHV